MKKDAMKNNDQTVRGMVLLGIGVVALLGNFGRIKPPDNLGLLLLPTMGVLFIISAIIKRQVGLLVPGGILSGIGVGIIAESNVFDLALLTDLPEGAAFMAAFAAGWLSIVVLSRFVADETQWWALIPAAIFMLIVGSLTVGGTVLAMLMLVGKAWPIILIGIGVKALLASTNEHA